MRVYGKTEYGPHIYLAPARLDEAIALLGRYKKQAVVVNGGTKVGPWLRERPVSAPVLIDIKGIFELKEISFTESEGLKIGACVTLRKLAADPQVRAHYPFLAEAARAADCCFARGFATCAGDLIASARADMLSPLLVCGASMLCCGARGMRAIPLQRFYRTAGSTKLAPDELVTGIHVPFTSDLVGAFCKLPRRASERMPSACGAVARIDGRYCAAFSGGWAARPGAAETLLSRCLTALRNPSSL